MVHKNWEQQYKLNLDISQTFDESYESFKNEGTRIFFIDLRKTKDKDSIKRIKSFSDHVFMRSISEENTLLLENNYFYILFGIVGLDRYLNNLGNKEANECIDFLTEFQNGSLGKIFLIGSSYKTIKELKNRNCRIIHVSIPFEDEKSEFYEMIKTNNINLEYLNHENLDLLFEIVGNDPKRIKKFANKFTKISEDKDFIYNNYYIKSIFHYLKRSNQGNFSFKIT